VRFVFKNNRGIVYEVVCKSPGKNLHGMCDSPETNNPKIYISPYLTPKTELNTTIHEFAHAFFWGETEKDVNCFPNKLTKFLYTFNGWRKDADKQRG